LAPVPLVAFVCRASRKKHTAKIVYRALSDAAHGKGASPCKMLPCALCRAPRQKTHGKGFAVRPDKKRTAKGLPCVLRPLPCARGARQSRCFP
jgi:hypothetical protein